MALEIAWERQDEIAIAILGRGRIDGSTTEQMQGELESGMGAEDQATDSGLRAGVLHQQLGASRRPANRQAVQGVGQEVRNLQS